MKLEPVCTCPLLRSPCLHPHAPAHWPAPRLVLRTLLQKRPQVPRSTSPAPTLGALAPGEGLPGIILKGFIACGTTGWRWRGPGQVGSGRDRAGGKEVTSRLWGLFRPLLIYLFFRRFLRGVGRRGWEEGVGGRREREGGEAGSKRDRSGVLARSRRAGARLRCAPPLLRVGDPAEAGVTMQRKARVAGRGGEQQGLGGSGFCRKRGLGATRAGAVRATVLNPCARRPVQPPALGWLRSPPCRHCPRGGPGKRSRSPRSAGTRGAVWSDAGPRPSPVSWR